MARLCAFQKDLAEMAGLLDWITGAVQQQYAKGAPYREAVSGLLQGDPTKFGLLAQEFNRKAQTPEGALDVALNFAPFGVTKIVSPKTQYEIAQEVAQRNAALPVSEGGLGLPKNNTAMDRARAMGFDTAPSKRLYHYAKEDWNTNIIDPSKSDLGFHVGDAEQAGYRAKIFGGKLDSTGEWMNGYGQGSNTIPLIKSKYSYMLPTKDEGSFHADVISSQLEKNKVLPKGYTQEILNDPLGNISPSQWTEKYDQEMRNALTKKGYHGIKYQNQHEGEGISYAFTNPSVLRSPFAAFDPFRRNEADILAGLLAVPTTQLMQPEEKKKKRNTK